MVAINTDCNWGKRLFVIMWHWIWEATTHSVNSDTNCKLLITRKFLNSRSRPGFFNDGYTTAVFQVSAKYPVCKERLTILVMAGRSESKHEDAGLVLSRCNHMTNCLSQAWHWKWENTISPDSDSRLGSGVDSKNAVQLWPDTGNLGNKKTDPYCLQEVKQNVWKRYIFC